MDKETTKEINEEIKESWYKGPIKYILAVFLILLLILWYIPSYSVKLDPEPKYIPEIKEVIPSNIPSENETKTQDFLQLITPNDPIIKQTADKIIAASGCDSNKICQSKAIFYFVRDKFNYVSDPLAFEYIKSAKESLMVEGGDCDDASVLAANLLQAIGIQTRFVFVPGHVYIQARLPEALKKYKTEQDWVSLDLTCKYCIFGEVPYQYKDSRKRYLP